ncbi:MAG: ABC transporter permease [archaeon]|nr:ABC transporter permease [archaeon]
MDLEIFSVALNNLRTQGLRTYLTLLGVIIGIAAIVSLVSVGEGLNQSIQQQFEQLGSNTIFILPAGSAVGAGSGSSGGFQTEQKEVITDSDVSKIRGIAEVDGVAPTYAASGKLEFGGETINVTILGGDPEDNEIFEESGFSELAEGRNLLSSDNFSATIGHSLAKDTFDNKEIPIRAKITLEGRSFKVVGISKETSTSFGGGPNVNNSIIIPTKGFKQIFPDTSPTFILVKTFNVDQAETAKEKIDKILEKAHGKDQFASFTSQQVQDNLESIIGIVSLVLVGIAAISLLVGGIGIMNAMFMSVIERTREIGVMKAIGATNSIVLQIFLVEAAFIGLVGGIIGIILGFGISLILSIGSAAFGSPINVALTPQLIVGVLLFAMIVGMASGYYPAKKAADLDPVEALRYE